MAMSVIGSRRLALNAAFVAMGVLARAQFSSEYSPLGAPVKVPDDYRVNVAESAKAYAGKRAASTKTNLEPFYRDVFTLKKMLFDDGDVYLPNPLSAYVDTVFRKLMAADPAIKDEMRVYVTRYTRTNALCLPDG